MKITKTFHARNRDEWRAWLKKNHDVEIQVSLVVYKKQTGAPSVAYDDAVEEALCCGWIDSVIQRIDEEKYARKFTPRKRDSKWSALNKRRVAKMIREGRMTEVGFAKLNHSGRVAALAAIKLVGAGYKTNALDLDIGKGLAATCFALGTRLVP